MPIITLLALFSEGTFSSPFVVPVAGCAMVLGIVLAGVWSGIRTRELEGQERLAAIAKGLTPPPTPAELAIIHGRPDMNLARRRANSRRAGIVLLFSGAGLALFFIVLTIVVQVREVLSGAAAALIPAAIGVGFLIDTKIQSREIEEDRQNRPVATPVELVR